MLAQLQMRLSSANQNSSTDSDSATLPRKPRSSKSPGCTTPNDGKCERLYAALVPQSPERRLWQRRLLLLGSLAVVSLFLLITSSTMDLVLVEDPQFQRERVMAKKGGVSTETSPLGTTEMRRYQCIGWRMTGECSPSGPRDPENDKNCTEVITQGMSGYCEVKDLDSGEHFQVMRKHCNGLKTDVEFRCSDAPGFANYHVEAADAIPKAIAATSQLPHVISDSQTPRDGIVMVVYPKLLSSAYAVIATLRTVLECSLPIEIWFHVDEIGDDYGLLAPLQQLATSVGGIAFHPMRDSLAKGYNAKIYAIYNSCFDRVLFLDADNVPVRDPSFLFNSSEFVTTGAVFWPDFWQPSRTVFNIIDTSMLWELLDVPFVDMFEQESGQILVDRSRHGAAMELVRFYAFHEPKFLENLKLVHGDKDLFRLAWLKLNASFFMIQTPAATMGRMINGSFCGVTMVQHDTKGQVMFLHRNQLKLSGERNEQVEKAAQTNTVVPVSEAFGAPQVDGYPDPAIWTHLLSFSRNKNASDYLVDAYHATPQFLEWQMCYGRRYADDLGPFYLEELVNLSFSGLEMNLRRFATEATELSRLYHESWVYPSDSTRN